MDDASVAQYRARQAAKQMPVTHERQTHGTRSDAALPVILDATTLSSALTSVVRPTAAAKTGLLPPKPAWVRGRGPPMVVKLEVYTGTERSEEEFTIKEGYAVVGRSGNIRFTSSSLSGLHAIVGYDSKDETWFVEDQSSTHGTFLNAIKLEPKQKRVIKHGDFLKFGRDSSKQCAGVRLYGVQHGNRPQGMQCTACASVSVFSSPRTLSMVSLNPILPDPNPTSPGSTLLSVV